MDDRSFDRLTRALGGASTRRAGLKAALGGLLGLVALPGTDGEAKKKKKRYVACNPVCPSGSACVNGVCTCTRPLCGGICCGSDRTACENGRCVYTGLRNCDGVKIVDGADLSFCDFRSKTIKTRSLKNASFDGADLSGATMNNYFQPWGCSFRGAQLVGTDLRYCDIKPGTSFAGANMNRANLRASHVDGADFSSATLTGIDLRETPIADSRFVDANLVGAILINSPIHGSDFRRAKMPGVVLGEWFPGDWSIIDTGFVEADLSGAKLGGLKATNLDLSRANLAGASLLGIKFEDSTLDGADLSRAEVGFGASGVTPALFTRCSMVGALMRDQLGKQGRESDPGLRFEDVDLRRATFGAPYQRNLAAWLRTDLTGAVGWEQPAGGYQYICSVTLPDGSEASATEWIDGAACP